MSQVFDPSWLEAISGDLQLPEFRRKNIIDIAGYPNWENVNSNILEFYFNEEEEHGLGRLFLNSLLEVIEKVWGSEIPEKPIQEIEALSKLVEVYRIKGKKKSKEKIRDLDLTIFDTPFTVERETGRIDLLIKGIEEGDEPGKLHCPWAIIIENKIHHKLDNPLDKYWQKTEADFKMGIILNLSLLDKPVVVNIPKENQIKYSNLTHKMLLDQVQSNLGDYFFNSDDRHLLYLKDYFSNIQSHYDMEKPNETIENNINILRQHNDEIKKLDAVILETRKYIFRNINEVMHGYGFKPITKYLAADKHYYHYLKKDKKGPLRMYVEIYSILENNKFTPVIELFDEYCNYGDEIVRRLELGGIYNNLPNDLNKLIDKSSGWYHIANLGSTIDLKSISLKEELDTALSLFFKKGKDKKSFYDHVLEVVNEEIGNNKN